ncbi:unnamed protein product [Oikopleura dioica]|uniref:Uncharacterized protein n=1 Tax=Oikopleura dioica TaxID=34765 RepID=E4Y962_OIKDI|nr:unnamed protein product [Oikopleura dioica]
MFGLERKNEKTKPYKANIRQTSTDGKHVDIKVKSKLEGNWQLIRFVPTAGFKETRFFDFGISALVCAMGLNLSSYSIRGYKNFEERFQSKIDEVIDEKFHASFKCGGPSHELELKYELSILTFDLEKVDRFSLLFIYWYRINVRPF